jgi:phospholipid/cholesterol/gamma-HCH transport system substrate-binding protein
MRRVALMLSVIVFVSVSCSSGNSIKVTARFDDVGDLATGAPVTMADINIGRVSDMRLAGDDAVVTLSLSRDARVPKDVTARVRRTSVLGERIVDIVVPDTVSDSSPLLEDGDNINDTVVRSDLEDLVDEGVEVLGAVSASQLAVMIQEGAAGFGGRGQELGNLLTNYRDIVHAYAGKSEELSSLIRSLRRFNDTIAQEAGAHARSVANTARSIEVLKEESGRLERAIVSLNRLAIGSRGILRAHMDEMRRFFGQMRTILGVLEEEQGTIRRMLHWAPGHNYNTQAVEWTEMNQVIQDFVICGLNDDPNNPARRCEGND